MCCATPALQLRTRLRTRSDTFSGLGMVAQSNELPFPFAHGYVNGAKWRNLISNREGCGGCPRMPNWSNLKIRYKGEPIGPAATDNSKVILEKAERVS
jgi:hypothetical protein